MEFIFEKAVQKDREEIWKVMKEAAQTVKKKEWFVISGLDSRNADYNNWYYAESDGKVIVDKWHKIDGKYYCFNASGVMRKGWLTETPEDDDKEVEP